MNCVHLPHRGSAPAACAVSCTPAELKRRRYVLPWHEAPL